MAPEPKKQATRGQKQIHKENQATIQFYTVLIVIVNAIYLAVTRLAFWSDFTLRYQLLFALTGGLYLGASGFMKRMSKSRFGADGNVVDAGVDLNMQSGMAEHLKDVIILMAIVQTTSLISNYMWLGLLVIPGRAFHLLWRTILAPYFFAPAPPEMDEKKQKKIERRARR